MEGHGIQTDLQAKDSFDGKYIPGTASLIAEVDSKLQNVTLYLKQLN